MDTSVVPHKLIGHVLVEKMDHKVVEHMNHRVNRKINAIEFDLGKFDKYILLKIIAYL